MLITLAILCIGQILQITAEENSSTDNKNVTDNIQEYKVNGDISRLPVTLKIISGKSKDVHSKRANYELPVNPLLYSNSWRPFPLPISPVRNSAEQKEYSNYQYYPLIHPYPDFLVNWTSPFSNYSESSIVLKDTPAVSSENINPLFFNPLVIRRRPENLYATDTRELQNTSDSISRPVISNPEVMDFKNNRPYYQSTLGGFPPFPLMPPIYMPTRSNGNIFRPNTYPAFTSPYLPMYSTVRTPATETLGSRSILYDNIDREAGSEKIESSHISNPSSGEILSDKISSGGLTLVKPVSPSLPEPNIVSSAVPIDDYRYGILPGLVRDLLPRIVPASNQFSIPHLHTIPEETRQKMPGVDLPTGTKQNLDSSNNVSTPNDTTSDPNTNMYSQLNEGSNTTNGTINENKISYHFGFDMNDGKGTDQHRKEISDTSGVVTGSYGYRDMYGVYRIVNYIADKNGFRAFIKSNEPGLASSGSAGVVVIAEKPPPNTVEDQTKVFKHDPITDPEVKKIIDEDTDED